MSKILNNSSVEGLIIDDSKSAENSKEIKKDKKIKKGALAITPDFRVVEGYLSGGNRADVACADDLTAAISGCYIIEDKGYDSNKHRAYLLSNNNMPVIPGRKNRIEPIVYDKKKFKLRSKVENFFAMLKENRRLALRYDKSDLNFLGFIAFASIKYNLC